MAFDEPLHLAQALARRRYLMTSWPWRALAYVATTVPISGVLSVGLLIVGAPVLMTVKAVTQGGSVDLRIVVFLTLAGLTVLAFAPIASMAVAALERWRMRIVDPRPMPAPGFRRLAARYASGAAWREVAYTLWLGGIVPIAYWMFLVLALLDVTLIASPWLAGDADRIAVAWATFDTSRQAIPYAIVGVVLIPILWYLIGLLAAAQASMARWLLSGRTVGAALREVTRSRARLVDAYETERRRIERDLHDGAQSRLTSLTLQLGLAKLDVPHDAAAARPLAIAHEQAKGLMVMLRQIVHGIRPQSLTDLGLAGSIRELARQATIPVTVHSDLDQPLSELIETTAYFVVAESLSNVARHASATRAEVRLARLRSSLIVEVEDDGGGGADPARGTGLTGLADRVGAVNGRLWLASPAGGPTRLRVELPCRR